MKKEENYGNVVCSIPQNDNQEAVEVADESLLIKQKIDFLNGLLEDRSISQEVKHKAQVEIQLLEQRGFQKELRSKVLKSYLDCTVSLQKTHAITNGDYLFSHQLVDRDFYRRARLNTQSKKEGRTIDRFEQ